MVAIRPVKVWDLPTRLFHWVLVLVIAVAWLSGDQGNFTVHFIAGQVALGLLLFRLIWGFVGSDTARFKAFVPTPARLRDYVRAAGAGRSHLIVGHNPIGAAMVFALLAVLGLQVLTGLFASENTWAFVSGPLARFIGTDLSETLTGFHKDWLFNILLGLIALHVLAAFFHLFVKKDNLIRPMVTGTKDYPAQEIGSVPRLASIWVALVLALVVATGVWALFTLV
nr:cytochrome b/b6 domain-containing protein [Roseospira visakhapatnamensis]